MKSPWLRYIVLVFGLACVAFVSQFAGAIFSFFHHSSDAELILAFFSISTLFILSFIVYHVAKKTIFPSFVIAIFFGIAAQPLLHPIIQAREVLSIIVGIGATLILFGGGLETPFDNFKKLVWKIHSLSFIGLFITALLFSLSLFSLGTLMGVSIPVSVALLLGAVLASTDPAAIIPVLKRLRFKKISVKDLVVSESAVTDVTGTLLTLAFLAILLGTGAISTVMGGYSALFTAETGMLLIKEILFGIVFGVIGYGLLKVLTRFAKQSGEESDVEAAYFLFVPIIIFAGAVAFGGSGYLAAFIAGLLFMLEKHLHHTERFFNHTIEGFLKPTIFILLGALVEIQSLIEYAGIGIVAALIFMFIIRPIAVIIALGPFSFFGKKKDRFSFKEILFVSFVRETGAIPAVLLVTIVSMGIPGLDGFVPIGMWIILATLIIEPPLTPWVAKKLGVATAIEDDHSLVIHSKGEPFVILGSRGYSFLERLDRVVAWSSRHTIYRVVVLHCLENKYTPEKAEEIGEQAHVAFKQINEKRQQAGELPITFEYVSRKGFLQDNIDTIAKEQQDVTAIFVGKRVLDYRLEQIKELQVPVFFMD